MICAILAKVSENMSDHDLLIRLDEKFDAMYILLNNHLSHHFLYNLALIGAVASLTGIILKLTWRSKVIKSDKGDK